MKNTRQNIRQQHLDLVKALKGARKSQENGTKS